MATTRNRDVRPSARPPHSLRARNDTWDDAARAAEEMRADVNNLTEQALEASLGYVRCRRGSCPDGPPIPVTFADLRGRPLREWIAGAVILAESQHPDHEPVTAGAIPPAEADLAAAIRDLQARMDELGGQMGNGAARSRAPGTPVFREPGRGEVVPVLAPEVPAGKKGRVRS